MPPLPVDPPSPPHHQSSASSSSPSDSEHTLAQPSARISSPPSTSNAPPSPSSLSSASSAGPAPPPFGPTPQPNNGPSRTFYFTFPIPVLAQQLNSPDGAPPDQEAARARFFQALGFGQRGPQSATPAGTPQPSPRPLANGQPATGGGEEQAHDMDTPLEEEMQRFFAGGDPQPASFSPSQPLAGAPPSPNVGPSNFPFAGLMPMGFNIAPPRTIMNQFAAMLGVGGGAGGPPPPPSPQGAAAAHGALAPEGMNPELMAHMQGFFPGFSVIPVAGEGPVPSRTPHATGPNPTTNGLSTSFSNAASPLPSVNAPEGQPPPNAALQNFINGILSQIMIVPPPSDPNAPPPDPNAVLPPPNGSPIVITLHFGGPPPQEEDKQPDPARAAELLSALEKPERGLLDRLDHGLRLEEKDAGVEAAERTGARCAVCLDSLLSDEDDNAKSKGTEESGDVAMTEDDEMEVLSLPCSHAFHKGCLGPWLETHTNCPTCRFDLDPLSTTLRPNRTATTLPTRTGTPNLTPLNPTPTSSSSSVPPSNNRAHPYSRSSSRPTTPQPPQPALETSASSAASSLDPNSRPYTPPPARLTLLSRVLSLESSHHLRCSIPLCAHAPSSSNPRGYPTRAKMLSLVRAEGELPPQNVGDETKRWVLNGCEHVFHPDCLRIAEGVYVGASANEEWENGKRKVWCPVRGCKGEGWVSKEDWEAEVEEEEEEEEKEVERVMRVDEKTTLAPMDLDHTSSTNPAAATTPAATTTASEADDLDLD